MTNQTPRILLGVSLVLAASGCSARTPAPTPPPEPAPYEFPHDTVWTALPGVSLQGDSAVFTVPRPFTALAVVDADSSGVIVSCDWCGGSERARVRHRDVLYEATPPAEAAYGSLATFALAVRDAAARADLDALAPVMAPEFTFSFVGLQGADRARAAWQAEGFQLLSTVPALLDRGLTRLASGIWVAPPEYAESLGYQGLRTGFRRAPSGAWEWIFLVRGQSVLTQESPVALEF